MNRSSFEQIRFAGRATARELGFVRDARGAWNRNGFELDGSGSWLALRRRAPFTGDPLRDALGEPGLWRVLPARRNDLAAWQWTFDLPALRAPEADDDIDDVAQHPCKALLAWAEDLEAGRQLAQTPPERSEVEGWLESTLRSVRIGGALREIELFDDPQRFGLTIGELARLRDPLAPSRETWLTEVCLAAQWHWQLVRVGLEEDRVRAEVDLSGAPAALRRPLFDLAHTALVCVARWAVPALSIITDPRASCEVLDHHPKWANARFDSKGVTQ